MCQLVRHHIHRLGDMREEGFVSGTQIIQAGFAIGCLNKAVFRAAPVADKADVAGAAEETENPTVETRRAGL